MRKVRVVVVGASRVERFVMLLLPSLDAITQNEIETTNDYELAKRTLNSDHENRAPPFRFPYNSVIGGNWMSCTLYRVGARHQVIGSGVQHWLLSVFTSLCSRGKRRLWD
jgi:hypothetical protein